MKSNNSDLLVTDSLVQYGDGLFETMLADKTKVYNFKYHCDRLYSGCSRLEIKPPKFPMICDDILKQLQQQKGNYFSIKVLVSRGTSLRGYQTRQIQESKYYSQISPYSFDINHYNGTSAMICNTQLARQPLLAGLKHTNRLEQILAKRELMQTNYYEGIMLDTNNNVIEGIISNIFIIKNKSIITPDLSYSGVAGTMRDQIIDLLASDINPVQIKNINIQDVMDADEVFFSNATTGITPLISLNTNQKRFDIIKTKEIINNLSHPCSNIYITQ